MASRTAWLKRGLAAAGLLALASGPLEAATFSPERGLNLDLWDTWPNEAEWSRDGVLLPYPEWRRRLDAEDLAFLKNVGFDFLRMPVDPIPFLSPKTDHLRERLLTSVLEGVRTINAAGLKAIVDLHPIRVVPTGLQG